MAASQGEQSFNLDQTVPLPESTDGIPDLRDDPTQPFNPVNKRSLFSRDVLVEFVGVPLPSLYDIEHVTAPEADKAGNTSGLIYLSAKHFEQVIASEEQHLVFNPEHTQTLAEALQRAAPADPEAHYQSFRTKLVKSTRVEAETIESDLNELSQWLHEIATNDYQALSDDAHNNKFWISRIHLVAELCLEDILGVQGMAHEMPAQEGDVQLHPAIFREICEPTHLRMLFSNRITGERMSGFSVDTLIRLLVAARAMKLPGSEDPIQ